LQHQTFATAEGELWLLLCSPLNYGLLRSFVDHTVHLFQHWKFNMLFLSSPSGCDVFIFMVSAHLDKGVESISEFGIPKIQILLPPQ
jgi:hypothetical protein